MPLSDVPAFVQNHYEIHEWRHGLAVLKYEFPHEFSDIMEVLSNFRLFKSQITIGGGNKSPMAQGIDSGFYDHGWRVTKFDTLIHVKEYEIIGSGNHAREEERGTVDKYSPTHQIDEYKNHIAVEMEWNNKDPFYDRDLNNFRLLFDLQMISVGIIITRTDELQDIFNDLGRGTSFGNNTTHMGQLLKRVEGGGGGGCPVIAFGISRNLYVEDI